MGLRVPCSAKLSYAGRTGPAPGGRFYPLNNLGSSRATSALASSPVGVRAPLDVDLEDKLIFGLTPLRFGYVLLAGLTTMAIWGQRWTPGPLRLVACLPILLVGGALGWGRWRGRGSDQWLLDAAAFLLSNYTIRLKNSGVAISIRQTPTCGHRSSASIPHDAAAKPAEREGLASPGLDASP